MKLTLRDWQPIDLDPYVRIHNAYCPDFAVTTEKLLHQRSIRREEEAASDLVGLVDGEPRLFGFIKNAIWFNEPGRGNIGYILDLPLAGTPIEREYFARLLASAFDRGYERVFTWCDDRHPHHRRTLEEAGFAMTMRYPVTSLDLETFDPMRYAATTAEVESQGIRILSLEDLAQTDHDWRRTYHDFHCAVVPDVPHAEPMEPMSWDEFNGFVSDPKRYSLAGKMVAVDDGRIVGISEIEPNSVDPTIGDTMLTAVRREYRRRGVASTVKAAALTWAKQSGMRRVVTYNWENNPMFTLNKSFGFREIYASCQYAKRRETP